MEKLYAYIDEYGNTSLDTDKDGTSEYYILVAVLVNDSNKDEIKIKLDEIKKSKFQNQEIKSSKVGNDHKRRKVILNELLHIDFKYCALVVNKTILSQNSPLQYKKTFIKFPHNLLYKQINILNQNISIYADGQGTNAFMDEFRNYVISKNRKTLMDYTDGDHNKNFSFAFVKSEDSVFIQLADFIAGTLSFKYESSRENSQFSSFYRYLKDNELNVKLFPEEWEKVQYSLNEETIAEYDEIIAKKSISLAVDFINNNKDEIDFVTKEKIVFLELLIRNLEFSRGEEYINSYECIKVINSRLKTKCSKRHFQTKIVAKLRDKGILIASSSSGYKIPTCKKDLYNFVNHTNTNIAPMFKRLKIARDRVKLATNGEFDILDKKEYSKLKEYVDNQAD